MATILIVDDQPANREYLTTLLGYGGHRLFEAADGAEALATVKTMHLDLVIADILMPTMDGYEFVRQLRADPAVAGTPVIFFTAHYHEREARALADACGVAHILSKPCEPEVVLRTVDAGLGVAPPPIPPSPPEEFDREHLRLVTDKLSQKADELRMANERLSALVELGLQLGSELDPRRLLKSFCHAARRIIGARCAITGILDDAGPQLRYLFTSGMDAEAASRLGSPDPLQGVLRTVVSEGRCLRLYNADGDPVAFGFSSSHPPVHSWLGAPIASPTRIYGWLGLIDKVGAEAFSEEDERLARILAAQVGRIYQNGSLYADVLRHASELEREVSERKRAEQRQTILLSVSQALAESATPREAAHKVLKAICDRLEWEVGSVWMVDRSANVLRCVEVFYDSSADHPEYPEWEALTRQMTFASGAGLPGRVWLNGQPTWIPNVMQEVNFPRAALAAKAGLHAAFAFPIVSAERILGVVEFYSSHFRQPDQDLLQLFTGISGPLGQFMERKQAEESLRESEEHTRLLLDSTAEAIYGIDMHGHCTFSNSACARFLGYAESRQLLGHDMHALMHHTRADGTPYPVEDCRIYQAFLKGEGSHVEDEVLWRADGSSFPAEYWSYPIRREGEVVGSVVTFLDITERKELEARFRQAQQRLQQVVASSPAVLFTLAIEGQALRPTWISENVREMMGYPVEDVFLPRWWDERVHPEDLERVLAEIERDLFEHGQLAQEYRFRRADGTYCWVRDEKRLRRGAAGEAAQVVGSWSDVTERRNLEDQFRQDQKMEAVGRLAGGVAHDFNNLLTVINGYGEMLLDSLPAGDSMRDMVKEVVAAGDRAARLTRQLLAFSRKAMIEPKVLDLKALVADLDKMLRRIIGEDIELAVVADPEAGAVMADPGHIEQVVMNLVVNARDAMPQEGRLTIEVRNVELDEIYVRTHADARSGAHVLLAVSDTGCGMDAATMSRIFEPFFSTKGERGTGLGLATVHGIVKQSGGHVAVYSEVGRGTTFKVYLPRVEQLRPSGKSHPGLAVMPHGSETVLLAEDEDGVRALSRHILQSCGYTVLEARDGNEAVRIAEQQAVRIDLFVTDVVMHRMGGREAAERVRKMHPGLKVLFLSGYTDDAVVRHGILEAHVAFLHKPFSPASLASKVREALDQPAEAPSHTSQEQAAESDVSGQGAKPPIRILLVDDHSILRAGIRKILQKLPRVEVVAEASDGREAIALVGAHHPNVVFMDIAMEGLNGLEATARMTQEFPDVRVIILSMHADEEHVWKALRAGAAGYVLKHAEPAEIELALETVVRSESYMTPAVSKHIVAEFIRRGGNEASSVELLTSRQRETLQLLAEGKNTKEIARLLSISAKTVEAHRAQIMERLDIRDLTGLVRYAIRVGLIQSDA